MFLSRLYISCRPPAKAVILNHTAAFCCDWPMHRCVMRLCAPAIMGSAIRTTKAAIPTSDCFQTVCVFCCCCCCVSQKDCPVSLCVVYTSNSPDLQPSPTTTDAADQGVAYCPNQRTLARLVATTSPPEALIWPHMYTCFCPPTQPP